MISNCLKKTALPCGWSGNKRFPGKSSGSGSARKTYLFLSDLLVGWQSSSRIWGLFRDEGQFFPRVVPETGCFAGQRSVKTRGCPGYGMFSGMKVRGGVSAGRCEAVRLAVAHADRSRPAGAQAARAVRRRRISGARRRRRCAGGAGAERCASIFRHRRRKSRTASV